MPLPARYLATKLTKRSHGASSDMRLPLALVAVAVAPRIVLAEPVHLACEGKMHASGRVEDYLMSLAIDEGTKTVTVGTYGSAQLVGRPGNENLFFMGAEPVVVGVSSGIVNRLTGDVSVHIITLTDGLYRFYGQCKPAKRLF